MHILTILFAAAVILAIMIFIGWRLASRRYTLPCPSWLAWMLEGPFGEGGRVRTALQRLELQPGMRVLDVGCGPGRLSVPVARFVGPAGEVTALDLQPSMLARARARAEVAGLQNIRFIQARAGSAELQSAYYDRALLVTVLGEIPDRQAALKEIYDALKPGGFLSLTELILDPHFQSHAGILRLAAPLGFHELHFFGNSFFFTTNLQKPAE